MVFGVLIANATTLQNFQCFERHFYRFYPFAVYAGRKYKAVGLEVVFVGIHAMVHGCSLFQKIQYAFQYPYLDCTVRKGDTEEFAFEFLETLFIFQCFVFLLLNPFTLHTFCFLSYKAVMLGFQIGRANVFRAVRVLSEIAEQVDVVAPYTCITYHIAVAGCDADGIPIGGDTFRRMVYEIT